MIAAELMYRVKNAWQGIRSRAGFSAAVIFTMSLTLGTLFCAFGLFYYLVMKPLPYQDSDSIYKVEQVQIDKTGKPNVRAYGYKSMLDFYKRQEVFSEVGIVRYHDEVLTSLNSQPKVSTAYATPDFFTTLGVKAHMGRLFNSSENVDAYVPSAMLSYTAWQHYFNADANIVGKKLELAGRSYTIVGITAQGFVEPELEDIGRQTSIWLAWDFNPANETARSFWTGRGYIGSIIGKLKPEFTPSQAGMLVTDQVNRAWQVGVSNIGFYNGWRVGMELHPLRDVILGEGETVAYLLIVCALSLLVIAVMNLFNLFIARALERQREFAIAAVVGAKPKDLRSLVFAETLMLMTISMLLGLIIAQVAHLFMREHMWEILPMSNVYGLDPLVITVAVLVSLLLSMFFSGVSIKVIDYQHLQAALMGSGKGTGAQISKRMRSALVYIQISIAAFLIFINLSFFISAIIAMKEPTLIKSDDLFSLEVSFNVQEEANAAQNNALLRDLKKELALLPQVEGVSHSASPLDKSFATWSMVEESSLQQVVPEAKIVDHDYFALMGQRLIRGQTFTKAQIDDREQVLVINNVLAERLAAYGEVIGMRLSFDVSVGAEASFKIIGVVEGVTTPGEFDIPPRIYRPMSIGNNFIIKLKPNQTLSRNEVNSVLKKVSNQLVVYDYVSLQAQKERKLNNQYVSAVSSVLLTLLTIVLASAGLYGVISYSINMRMVEIGVRISLGAKRKDILKLVILDYIVPFSLAVLTSIALLFLSALFLNDWVRSVMVSQGEIIISLTLSSLLVVLGFSITNPLYAYFKFQIIDLIRGSAR